MPGNLLAELPLHDSPEGGVFSAADYWRRLPPWGDWRLATWLHGITWEWRVTEDAGRKVLEHLTIFTSCLRTGDGSWGDFTLEFDVRQMHASADTSMDEPFNVKARAGVMFRYQAYRYTYALFLECLNRVVLYRREENAWIVLASREMPIDPARYYRFKVECEGERIRCWMDDEPLFDVVDGAYRRGRMAVYANSLARFGSLRATTDQRGADDAAAYLKPEQRAAAKSAEGLAKPVLWRTIPCPGVSAQPQKIALDISPEGALCGAVVAIEGEYRDKSLLTAFDLEGNVKWSHTVSDKAKHRVWDLDGDGKQEVICFDGPTIKLIDITTGEVKLERAAPPCNERGSRGGREDETPHLPAYSLVPANVRGVGPGRDIVVYDMYTAFWVLNDRLELEWWRNREHGHNIAVHDIDGDGRDEVLLGWTTFDDDGSLLWEIPGMEYRVYTHDHVDHIQVGEFDGDPDNGLEVAFTAGNAGFFIVDQEGNVRSHHDVGHAQSLQAGRYRDDLPGKQFLVGCLWGNSGTRTLISAAGERLWTIEPDNSCGYDKAIRWAPDRDLFLLISTPHAAGLYDGDGRRIIDFPEVEASVKDRPLFVGDFTGDGLDEFVFPTKGEIRVYTQGIGNR